MLRDISDAIIIGGPGFENAGIAMVLDRIWKEWRRRSLSPSVLEGLGMELLDFRGAAAIGRNDRGIPPWLLKVREIIDDCCDEEIGIADLAAQAGVHPVYLARVYRRYFACSPGEYLRHCRLLRVNRLLAETDLPLAQLALQCGFSDQSQMTRSFTDSFGTSPARFRRVRRG